MHLRAAVNGTRMARRGVFTQGFQAFSGLPGAAPPAAIGTDEQRVAHRSGPG